MPKSSADQLQVQTEPLPDWISESYFEKALKSYRNDNSVKIQKFKCEFKSKWGEGYASVMVRVMVEYEVASSGKSFQETYLVKYPFEADSFAVKFYSDFDIYNQEMTMYEEHLPVIKKTLQEAGIPDDFYPETLCVDHEHSAIIFEDLQVKSYKLGDCYRGFDMKQTKMVLDKLARMHAASAKVDRINPGIYKKCDRGLHNRYADGFDVFYNDCLENCIRAASKWKGYEKYVVKMKKLRPHLMEKTRKCFDMKPHLFNVLAHGDLWGNNVMFQYDENGEVVDVKIFDFQYCVYTSPAIDLMLFLNTSCQDELRFSKRAELTEYYYEQLVKNLEILKYDGKIPNLEEFWDQYNEDSFYCFVAGCMDRAVCCINCADDADFECIMGTKEKSFKYRQKMFDNARMQTNLKIVIPYFYLHGLLEV